MARPEPQLAAIAPLAHGAYNLAMAALFLFQASLGLGIRKARKAGLRPPADAVRRHRRLGPYLALLGFAGYAGGLALGLLGLLGRGAGPAPTAHLVVGTLLALSVAAAALASRAIRGDAPPARDRHFALGLLLLLAYVVQIGLGLRQLR